MTACWSKGRKQHCPYYLCDTRACPSRRKSVPRADIEDAAHAMLRSLQPARQLFAMTRAMLIDAWGMRLAEALSARQTLAVQIRDIEGQIESLLDRIVDASNASVVQAYEARIDKLERRKIGLSEQAA